MEKLTDEVSITLNKNSIYGDRSAVSPGGVRIGTPALTTRGFKEWVVIFVCRSRMIHCPARRVDFEKVADFLHRAVAIALEVQAATGGKALADFVKARTNPLLS